MWIFLYALVFFLLIYFNEHKNFPQQLYSVISNVIPQALLVLQYVETVVQLAKNAADINSHILIKHSMFRFQTKSYFYIL